MTPTTSGSDALTVLASLMVERTRPRGNPRLPPPTGSMAALVLQDAVTGRHQLNHVRFVVCLINLYSSWLADEGRVTDDEGRSIRRSGYRAAATRHSVLRDY